MSKSSTWRSRLSAVIREPLVHFLIAGAGIFALFSWTGANRDPADYAIAVTEQDIQRLQVQWMQNFRRAPTRAELDGLIDDMVREELYYREALRLGMDRDDAVIKRRLSTKWRFLNLDDSSDDAPDDATLQRFMDDNAGKYAMPPRLDFGQVYLGEANRVDAGATARLISDLNSGQRSADTAGLPLTLPKAMIDALPAEIDREFGADFAAALLRQPVGRWAGPVASGFGLHLVRVGKRLPGGPATLDDVRQQVANDWRSTRKTERETAALAKLKQDYNITIAGRD